MKRKPFIICSSPDPKDDQLQVIVYPKDNYYSFDCIRLKLKDMKGDLKKVDMTPDEALEISSMLSNSVQVFLLSQSSYAKFINKEKKKNGKKIGFKRL